MKDKRSLRQMNDDGMTYAEIAAYTKISAATVKAVIRDDRKRTEDRPEVHEQQVRFRDGYHRKFCRATALRMLDGGMSLTAVAKFFNVSVAAVHSGIKIYRRQLQQREAQAKLQDLLA